MLVVDDSATARLAIRGILEKDDRLLVVGEASDGAEALRQIRTLRPSIVTMDVHLPGMDGIAVTEEVMRSVATPIVVVTGAGARNEGLIYRALAAGALEVWPKPPPPAAPDHAAFGTRFRNAVRALAQVPVVHRRQPRSPIGSRDRSSSPGAPRPVVETDPAAPAMLAVGASTGGPPLIQSILAALPRPFPWPIVVVQHIAAGFTTGFAEWLGQATAFPAALVDRRLKLEPGRLFVAADDQHLLAEPNGWVAPSRSAERAYLRPSIDVTFESIAARGAAGSVALLLTGMGKDGAAGLKTLRERGAHTIVQDPASALVDSMPRSAIALGAACDVLSPAVMADTIVARLRGAPERG